MADEAPVISTGVPTLDLLLAGGIPRRQSVVITGAPGTGKTILCSQIAFAQAAAGHRVVLATVASESNDKLLDELRGFSFFNDERIGNELYLLSAYPWLRKGPKDARDVLLKEMRERQAKLLFVDGLRSLRDLWQNEAQLRDFLYELSVGIAQLDAIALLTTEYELARLMEYPEATTVDGIVSLSARRIGGRLVRRLQVAKLRGRAHLTGDHLMHITAKGIDVVPRIEETTVPLASFVPTRERDSFGLRELDAILGGGLPQKSTTLLAGSTGIGKTLMALHFLVEGARRGECGLLVTYSEPVERLVHRARDIGLDVQPLLDQRKLVVRYRSTLNAEADDLVKEILDDVTQLGAKRVVVDGVGDLEETVIDPERMKPILAATIVRLRDAGVTSIFIKEIAKIAGNDLDFSGTPISVTAENLLFARHIELRGKLHRVLSVLKMRESKHDPYVREFEISDGGIKVLEPMSSAEGLLTGSARFVGTNGGAA